MRTRRVAGSVFDRNMQDEILDLVNDNDEVIGQMPRSEVHAKKLHNFRVINAFVMNDEGKIFIPRRTAHKRLFPNALDMSVGGHVETGEDYLAAFRRETMEELAIDIDQVPWRDLGALNYREHGVNAFMHVYEIRINDTPHYNPDDFSEHFWLSPQELLARLAAGDQSKGDLPILVRYYYLS